jgi:MFS transporter, Spinster family, sphingosine-1-phosphate transporter
MIVTPRSNRNASSRPSRGQARFAFCILFAINMLNYADRYVLPAILPRARQDLGLTTIEEGLLGSSFLLVYGLTTLPLGAWADRGMRGRLECGNHFGRIQPQLLAVDRCADRTGHW